MRITARAKLVPLLDDNDQANSASSQDLRRQVVPSASHSVLADS